MFKAYTTPGYQVGVYRTIGPLGYFSMLRMPVLSVEFSHLKLRLLFRRTKSSFAVNCHHYY